MSETTQKTRPVYKVSAGTIEAAVWQQKGEKGDFLTVNAVRNYKDKDGNWQKSTSLRINDIPSMQLVLTKAFEYAKLKETANEAEGKETE